MCQGSLSQARRTVEKRVIQGFTPHLCRLYIDMEVGNYLPLTGECTKFLGTDNSIQILIFAVGCFARVKFAHCHSSSKIIQI